MLIKTIAFCALGNASLSLRGCLLAKAHSSIAGMKAQVKQVAALPLQPILVTAACTGQRVSVAYFRGGAEPVCRGH